MTSSRPNSSRPALGLREIVFDARPRNQRNLTSRQQSALWGAFCRSPHKTEDPGRLAPDLDRNPIQRSGSPQIRTSPRNCRSRAFAAIIWSLPVSSDVAPNFYPA